MIPSDAALIEKAEVLLREGKNDEAIDVLRSPGAPVRSPVCGDDRIRAGGRSRAEAADRAVRPAGGGFSEDSP